MPGCALALEEVSEEANYPKGVFQTMLIGSSKIEGAVDDDCVRAATLTGSGPAGSAVAETAGRNLKKTVLELGGSDPFVVLDDADLGAAVETCVTARNQDGGQPCLAAKRSIVHTDVYDEFVDAAEDLTVGDPTDEDTDMGPQADAHLIANLHEQVEASIEAGATVLPKANRSAERASSTCRRC